MATTFPTSLDSFTNPTSTSNQNDAGVEHHLQHANANDAIEALEVAVGITGSADVNSIQYKLTQLQPKIALTGAPATATSTGTAGEIVVAGGYIYICTATNTWVRAAVATW